MAPLQHRGRRVRRNRKVQRIPCGAGGRVEGHEVLRLRHTRFARCGFAQDDNGI